MQSLEAKSETRSPVLLNVADLKLRVTPEEFERLCQLNRDLRLELTKDGESIVMSPTGGETGKRNINIAADVVIWNRQTGLGEAFDSSTGYNFTAFGGRNPSPDVSWIDKSRLEGIDISGFIPVVPDFAIELRSKSDLLKDVRAKMEEYRRRSALGLADRSAKATGRNLSTRTGSRNLAISDLSKRGRCIAWICIGC